MDTNFKMRWIKTKQYHTNLKDLFLQYKYSKLTLDNGNHEDMMHVMKKVCRTLALYSYTNSSYVIDTTVPGPVLHWYQKPKYWKLICSGLGQLLTLIGYRSKFREMAEVETLYLGYDLPQNFQVTPDTLLFFNGC